MVRVWLRPCVSAMTALGRRASPTAGLRREEVLKVVVSVVSWTRRFVRSLKVMTRKMRMRKRTQTLVLLSGPGSLSERWLSGTRRREATMRRMLGMPLRLR
uniref:Uncharacterized protein n=1 Tax=Hyaloperonospora arabidopsidis (strain Emoy2) TaxID=559515 RepID=M4C5D5_HYAAE